MAHLRHAEHLVHWHPSTVSTQRTPSTDLSSPRLDRLLDRVGSTRWAHVTAWNPGSQELPPAENEGRQAALIAELTSEGYRVLPGDGGDPDSGWTEPTAFVLDITRRRARAYGRKYGQVAIVTGHRGRPARLVACQPG